MVLQPRLNQAYVYPSMRLVIKYGLSHLYRFVRSDIDRSAELRFDHCCFCSPISIKDKMQVCTQVHVKCFNLIDWTAMQIQKLELMDSDDDDDDRDNDDNDDEDDNNVEDNRVKEDCSTRKRRFLFIVSLIFG